MRRVALLIIAIVLWLPPAAGAGPIATVGSAQGEAEVRNQFGLEGWMPQLSG